MLDRFLEVLRSGRFPGGEPLQFRSWSVACWGRDSPLKTEVRCCEYKAPRDIVPRHLSVLPKNIGKFRCLDIGAHCLELVRPVPAKGKREAPSSVGYYVPALTETVASDTPSSSMPLIRLGGDREDAEVRETRRTITLQAQLQKQLQLPRVDSATSGMGTFAPRDAHLCARWPIRGNHSSSSGVYCRT